MGLTAPWWGWTFLAVMGLPLLAYSVSVVWTKYRMRHLRETMHDDDIAEDDVLRPEDEAAGGDSEDGEDEPDGGSVPSPGHRYNPNKDESEYEDNEDEREQEEMEVNVAISRSLRGRPVDHHPGSRPPPLTSATSSSSTSRSSRSESTGERYHGSSSTDGVRRTKKSIASRMKKKTREA
jgi:hypothetical protein